jgi:hypothetical protein
MVVTDDDESKDEASRHVKACGLIYAENQPKSQVAYSVRPLMAPLSDALIAVCVPNLA